MNKVVLIFLCIVMIDGLMKKENLFELFIEGVKEGLSLLKSIFVTLMAFMLFVQLLKSSGFIDILSVFLQPVLTFFHIPVDIFVLGLLRPVSANASLSFLYSIYEVFGVDHPLSLLSTLIQSGSDTTLYVVTLYFSSIRMKETSYSLWIGFLMDFLSFFIALIIYLKVFV